MRIGTKVWSFNEDRHALATTGIHYGKPLVALSLYSFVGPTQDLGQSRIGTIRKEKLCDVHMSIVAGCSEWCLVLSVCLIHISTISEQDVDDIDLAMFAAGIVEGGVSEIVGLFDVSAVVDQETHAVDVAILRRKVKRGRSRYE